MTTDREMATMYADQQAVVATLHALGEPDLAGRLASCAAVRRERHHGDGWPRICRSAACVWCRRPMMRSWWFGMTQWTATASTWSLAMFRLNPSAGLPDAVRRLRRGLRDARDRMAQRWRRWRDVCFAGIAGGDHIALMLVAHEGIDRREVADVLRRRWPDVVVKDLEGEEPATAMSAADAADLGCCRRGVEPVRVVVMAQRDPQPVASIVEPMPMVL